MIETEYVVYAWEDEGMTFARRVFVKHLIGVAVTPEMVRAEVELHLDHLTAGKYRAIPVDRWVDVTIKAEVVLA